MKPKTEAYFQNLSVLATQISESGDFINERIKQVEARLDESGCRYRGSITFDGEGTGHHTHMVSWERIKRGDWRLTVASKCVESSPVPLLSAPLHIRIAAIKQIEPLLKQLVDGMRDLVDAYRQAVKP